MRNNKQNEPAWVEIVGTAIGKNLGDITRLIIAIAIAIPVARLFGADI